MCGVIMSPDTFAPLAPSCKCGPCPLHVNRNADYLGTEFWNTPLYQPKHRKPGPAQTERKHHGSS